MEGARHVRGYAECGGDMTDEAKFDFTKTIPLGLLDKVGWDMTITKEGALISCVECTEGLRIWFTVKILPELALEIADEIRKVYK